jgi:hypothetical protein
VTRGCARPGRASGSVVKRCLRALRAVIAMLAIAWLIHPLSILTIVSIRQHQPLFYIMTLTVQMTLALMAAHIINVAISLAGSIVRGKRHSGKASRDRLTRRFSTPAGMIIGLMVVGFCMGWAKSDVYEHPKEDRRVVVRRANLFEEPLGLPAGSNVITTVTAKYQDEEWQYVIGRSREFTDGTVDRVADRTVLWSRSGPKRAVVKFNSGGCIFFPDLIDDDDACRDAVIEEYLAGESIDHIRLMLMEVEEGH